MINAPRFFHSTFYRFGLELLTVLAALFVFLAATVHAAGCPAPVACTTHGLSTSNLQLCSPGVGDQGAAAGLNGNSLLLDSLFTHCALQPAFGGTGLTTPPDPGDLLVGLTTGTYTL